jgi:hypothetical protein
MVTCFALVIEMLGVLTSLLGALVQIRAANELIAGDETARATLLQALRLEQIVAVAAIPMMIAVALSFILWFYRAHKNLASFRNPALEYRHSAAVWSFVVPIASLIMPLWVMQEVWKGSAPSLPRGDSAPFDAPKSRVAEIWWLTFIVRSVMSWVFVFQTRRITGLRDILSFSYAQLALASVTLIAAGLAVRLVTTITRRQELCSKLPVAPDPVALPVSLAAEPIAPVA